MHDSAPQKSRGRSARRRARELALQGLYQWLVAGQDAAAIDAQLRDADGGLRFDEVTKQVDLAHYS